MLSFRANPLSTDAKLININQFWYSKQSLSVLFKRLWRIMYYFNTHVKIPFPEVLKCLYFIKMKDLEDGGGKGTRHIVVSSVSHFRLSLVKIFIPLYIENDVSVDICPWTNLEETLQFRDLFGSVMRLPNEEGEQGGLRRALSALGLWHSVISSMNDHVWGS